VDEVPKPALETRGEQRHAAIPVTITMDGFAVIDGVLGELPGWPEDHDLDPAGPPFVRYQVIGTQAMGVAARAGLGRAPSGGRGSEEHLKAHFTGEAFRNFGLNCLVEAVS
jgi:hypothetical protein